MNERIISQTNEQDVESIGFLEAVDSYGLPFVFDKVVAEVQQSAEQATVYQDFCQITLSSEEERLRRIEELSTEASKESEELVVKQNSINIEFGMEHATYLLLLKNEQEACEYVVARRADLEDAQFQQSNFNSSCGQLTARIKSASVTSCSLTSMEKEESSLGRALIRIGSEISGFQDEIELIETKELVELRDRIVGSIDNLTRLRQEIGYITHQIEDLVTPANDLRYQDLFRGNGRLVRPEEAPVASLNRFRKLGAGSIAVKSSEDSRSALKRTEVNLVQI